MQIQEMEQKSKRGKSSYHCLYRKMGADDRPPIPCYHLQILIVANHINGKDTHVRGLKVFGPLDSSDL
jgi:hypothetical protein